MERYVQTINKMLKKAVMDKSDINIAILNYRNTLLTGIRVSPVQLLMKRRLRSRLPAKQNHVRSEMQTSKKTQIQKIQDKQKHYIDKHTGPSHKKLNVGDKIKYITQDK